MCCNNSKVKANISFIEYHWQRMQGAERRRAGFCFPLMDQVALPFFFYLNVAVSTVYHVMFYSCGLIPAHFMGYRLLCMASVFV